MIAILIAGAVGFVLGVTATFFGAWGALILISRGDH